MALLVKRVDQLETVERVILQAQSLVALSSQRHVKCRFSELLEHQILVGSLLVEQWLKDGAIRTHIGDANEGVGCFLAFVEQLVHLCDHERRLYHAVRGVVVHFVV